MLTLGIAYTKMLGSINMLLLLIPFTLAAVIASSISAREVHSGIESKPQEGMEDYFRKAQLVN